MSFLKFTLLIFFLAPHLLYAKGRCSIGFSSGWTLTVNQKVSLEGITPRRVCHFVKKQSNANFHFKFFKNKKLIHETWIRWENIAIIEKFEKGAPPQGTARKEKAYMILTIPVPHQALDSYEVWNLKSRQIAGKGTISEKNLD